MPEVKRERSGWRDERLSSLHRTWGWDLPMVDIDWLVTEYDSAMPAAIVEYKNEKAKPADPKHPSYRAIKWLADMAGIPFFACRYASDFSWWLVVPLNEKAKEFLRFRKKMTQEEYIHFMYSVRGKDVSF